MGCSALNLNAKKASLNAVQMAFKHGFDVLSETDAGLQVGIVIPDKLTTWENTSVFRLPSNGEPLDDCGDWVHPLSCPNHSQPTISGQKHDRFVVMHTCDKPDCPVCSTTWAAKSARRATERLFEAQRLYKLAGAPLGKIYHATFSPPHDEAVDAIKTEAGYRKFRSNAIKTFKKAGVKGGLVIFHPFRHNKPEKANYNPSIPAYVWYLSPHFHVVGSGFLMKSDDFYNETGWIYKKHDERVTVKGTIKYQLTHCGINENFHAITYFGALSYNKVVIDTETVTDEPVKCRACGEALHEYEFTNEFDKETGKRLPDWNEDLGVYFHKVRRRTFKLRTPGTKRIPAFYTDGYIEIKSEDGV